MDIERDNLGFLCNHLDWTPAIAEQLSAEEDITLSEAHWEIINLLRQFYIDFDHAPPMRILVKHIKTVLGEDKGNSIYLLGLFPGSPAKIASKIAGLPKPTNCL